MDRNVQPTIEEIFAEIDADRSGFVELAELEGWWHQNRGDEGLLQKFELAFRTVQDRQRTVGLSSEQFKKVIVAVAADNWMRRVDESGRPFVYNRITHENDGRTPAVSGPLAIELSAVLISSVLMLAMARPQAKITRSACASSWRRRECAALCWICEGRDKG